MKREIIEAALLFLSWSQMQIYIYEIIEAKLSVCVKETTIIALCSSPLSFSSLFSPHSDCYPCSSSSFFSLPLKHRRDRDLHCWWKWRETRETSPCPIFVSWHLGRYLKISEISSIKNWFTKRRKVESMGYFYQACQVISLSFSPYRKTVVGHRHVTIIPVG